jgi:uncharacterized membrane protein
LLAVVELIIDKLPNTPARTAPPFAPLDILQSTAVFSMHFVERLMKCGDGA